jgi:hypothetical protein
MTRKESARLPENRKEAPRAHTSRDQDKGKGATEQQENSQAGNTRMQGQLGHRDEDAELKDADAGLPG